MIRSLVCFKILVMVFSASAGIASEITVLHSFSGALSPRGGLTLDGSTLYGTTITADTVYKIATNATGFTILHSFSGGANDGDWPSCTLAYNGSTLFGTTMFGGDPDSSGYGTIFKIGADGAGFSLMHIFSRNDTDGTFPDGRFPKSNLILSGSTLYGLTGQGGAGVLGAGTIFKIDTQSNDFELLHTFIGGGSDGAFPGTNNNLTVDGSTLYGTVAGGGGSHDNGILFKVDTDGDNYTILHSFDDGEGRQPTGGIVSIGSTLYGMTSGGGDNDIGTIFQVDADGANFKLLHEFAGSDGSFPHGSLILVGSTLYGVTMEGGASGKGTIFQIDTDGSNFHVLDSFDGTNGALPNGDLIVHDSILYGTAQRRGDSPLGGVIFSIAIPEPSTLVLLGIGALGPLAYAWRRRKGTV